MLTRAEWKRLFAPGVRALRKHWMAFVLLQLAAFASVLAYYHHAGFQGVCERLSGWKSEGGLWAAAGCAAVAGAILPELLKTALIDRVWGKRRVVDLLFQTGYFAVNGILVDLFYRLQTFLFGSGVHWTTVLAKMAFDQFVYTPLISIPYALGLFTWRESGFRIAPVLQVLRPGVLLRKGSPLLACTLAYWIPMVLCIYALPVALQFVLFVFALAAWALILVFIVQEETAVPAA